jgi:hypothetical protein
MTNVCSNWVPGSYYARETKVIYDNRTYKCVVSHKSNNGWEQANMLSVLWTNNPYATRIDDVVYLWTSG